MVGGKYIPEAGDVVWLDFTPQAGREQAGRRPGIVLTPRSYNEKTSLAIVCPVTGHVKGYPFEVAIPTGLRIRGAVLSDHMKSVDWEKRRAQRAGKIPKSLLQEILDRIAALLGIS